MLFFSRVSLRGESSSPEWLTALVIFVRRLNPSLTSTFWKVVLCWVRRLGSQRQFGWIFFLLRWGSIRWLCCCWQKDKKNNIFSHHHFDYFQENFSKFILYLFMHCHNMFANNFHVIVQKWYHFVCCHGYRNICV